MGRTLAPGGGEYGGQVKRDAGRFRDLIGRRLLEVAPSDGGARRWAMVGSLVETAKLNGVKPYAWLRDVLRDVLSKMVDGHPQQRLDELLPWKLP